MLKKILLSFGISTLLIFYAFANFSYISHYYLYFQNNNSKEQRYIETRTSGNWNIFDRYLIKYLNWSIIWWESKLENWKLTKVEEAYIDYDEASNSKITYSQSWVISVWSYGINFDNKIVTRVLTNVSNLKAIWYQDLSRTEIFKIYFNMFLDLFWIWFLLFLPLNIIVFSCFWYLLFVLFERFWFKAFKNIYINSFLAYLIIYLILINNWLSFVGIASEWPFWFMAYAFFVWVPKFVVYLISYYLLWKFHEKHPEKNVIYKKVLYCYFLLFCLFIIVSQIVNHYR